MLRNQPPAEQDLVYVLYEVLVAAPEPCKFEQLAEFLAAYKAWVPKVYETIASVREKAQ